MRWFYNLKISNKLIVAFMILVVFAAINGLTGYFGAKSIAKSLEETGKIGLPKVKALLTISESLSATDAKEKTLLSPSLMDDERKIVFNEMDTLNLTIKTAWSKYEKLGRDAEENQLWEKFIPLWNKWENDHNAYIKLVKDYMETGDPGIYNMMLDQSLVNNASSYKAAKQALNNIALKAKKEADKNIQIGEESTSRVQLFLLIIIAIGVFIALFLARFMAGLITTPLIGAVKLAENLRQQGITNLGIGLEKLSKGDTGEPIDKNLQKIEVKTNDEIGDLTKTINGMLEQTQQTIDSFNTNRENLINVVDEISKLIKSSHEGDFKTRGNQNKFEGTYAELIKGFNETLDAIVKPIEESINVLATMAQGDLTLKVEGNYQGDMKKMKDSTNYLIDSLSKLILEVAEAVQATASASNEIFSTAEEMAAGAQEQSAQTTEVASAIEQVASTIIETTKNAGAAAENARKSGEIAVSGGESVSNTVRGMNRISKVVSEAASTVQELGKNSNQIGEIIQVINDIADQTNLLALNAAIEAARAGEQGRGFAVVADEVRKLAERTTKATNEIASMIKKIQVDTDDAVSSIMQGTEEVKSGLSLAEESGQALQNIISSSNEVVDVINQVASASEEQASAAEQISKSIEAINNVAQESATGIQHVAQATEDLSRLTENLQNLVNQFKIDAVHSQLPEHSQY